MPDIIYSFASKKNLKNKNILKIIEKNEKTLKLMDNFTLIHAINTAFFIALIINDIKLIEAGLLHDVGKIFIPQEYFFKTKLSKEEKEILQSHVVFGSIYLKYIKKNYLSDYALLHHERIDGSGYPFGLKIIDKEIQIIGIVDIIEAMIMGRFYRRKTISIEDARKEILTKEKNKFDEDVINLGGELLSKIYINFQKK